MYNSILSDDLLTGIEKIDKQHSEFLKNVNMIMNSFTLTEAKEKIAGILEFFFGTAFEHYADEEKAHVKYNFPNYRRHKLKHLRSLENFLKLKKIFEDEGMTINFINCFHKELNQSYLHLHKDDLEFARYMQKIDSNFIKNKTNSNKDRWLIFR